ncbi:hypothetical protein TrLO_g7149 [Triparma laevis f. longispina]|uniref:Uncharacterized protein n=1 Tax=Triparma laevis f. longispina TaxID=1714387 RepID=A0A9W7EAV2_9STRA|nr:hypothetical protein TrLO_g7149 [Triparma laevis f. longispina]
MSKSVATESHDHNKHLETSWKRGWEDHGNENGEGILEVPPSESLPISTDDFMATNDFRRLLRGYVDIQELIRTLRLVCKPWKQVAEEKIDRDFESGALMVLDGNGNGISLGESDARKEKRKSVKRVIFLLNITMVRKHACMYAGLFVVEIPEGVEHIDARAFACCSSLTKVSFPRTLSSIEEGAFMNCPCLDNVDLLHTNLQLLGWDAFAFCVELKSVLIPDSLQILGGNVFGNCYNLVPSNIDVQDDGPDDNIDTTSEVIAYLRTCTHTAQIVELKSQLEQQTTQIASLKTQLNEQAAEYIATITALKNEMKSEFANLKSELIKIT